MGIGGMEIEGNEASFAYNFMDSMNWEIITCERR